MSAGSIPPIALTMGEPAGIGGEITLKAWQSRKGGDRPFFTIDDPARLEALAKSLNLAVPVIEIGGPEEASRITSYNVCYTKLLRPLNATPTAIVQRWLTG